jgi:hypothetical protein
MKVFILSVCFWGIVLLSYSQQPVFTIDIELSQAYEIKENVSPDKVSGVSEVMLPSFVIGIDGYAIDLSSDAPVRAALRLESSKINEYLCDNSFCFSDMGSYKNESSLGNSHCR